MQIVIEIPEEIITDIKDYCGMSIADAKKALPIILNAIHNSTPLPKEHGRLIDADVFEKRLMDARLYYIGEKADDFDLRFASGLKSAVERLVDAPTIIEADTESEDKE